VRRPETVGIIGLGLIGTSLGMALRQQDRSVRVVGMDVEASAVAVARARGAITESAGTFEAFAQAELVVIAVPPAAVVAVATAVAAVMKPGGVLTDVASTKAAIVQTLGRVLPPHVHYVGGHPMAGAEGQGAANADPTLFVGRPFVLTPTAQTNRDALATVSAFVEGLGMHPVVMTPIEHDAQVAQVSHLPYLVAVAVLNAASDEALAIGGPTLAAFARIADSPAALWTQIAHANRTAIVHAVGAFRRELEALERSLADGPALQAHLARASERSPLARSEP